MSQYPAYKNITATVRTPRCAILINEKSAYWKSAIIGAIAKATEIWGGRYFLIIPTDGKRIKEKFWELLQAYSPDHIAVFDLALADLKEADPAKYETSKQNAREQWDAKGLPGDFDEWYSTQAGVVLLDRLTISDSLERQLLERLSPFHFQGAVRQRLSHRSGFAFPFTKVSDIIPFTTRHIGEIVLPKNLEDTSAALLMYSQTGIASSEYCKELKSKGFVTSPRSENLPTPELFEQIFGGKGLMLAHSQATPFAPIQDYMTRTPFAISMLHLAEYYRVDLHQAYREPLVVVLGDTIDDFCFYYSLSRLHERVCWLPLEWLRSCYRAQIADQRRYKRGEPLHQGDLWQQLARTLVNLFFELIEYGHGEKRVELRSMSLSTRQLIAYRRQMTSCCMIDADRFASHIDCLPIDRSSTNCILRVFEQDNYMNEETVVFIDRNSVGSFPTPKPKNFSQVQPSGHYWITSLRIAGYDPPTLFTLGREIINIHDLTTESRVANDGIAYHCPNIAYFGGGIDAVLVRPKIHMPNELELLGAYFSSIGVTIQYSDKGNYFVDTLERFGGLDMAGAFIKHAPTREILEKFMFKISSDDGSVIFLSNDQRAYLSFEAIKASLDDEMRAASVIDELVGNHVLQRGYLLRCDRCRLASWYSIDVLTSDFTCNRCSFRQQFRLTHWKNPVEPRWYYRLAETVYQFYFHNSHLTTQVLYKLKNESRVAFHYVPEIELVGFPGPEDKREIDIACILDGQIIIGEGKTESLRPRDVGKFEQLSQRLTKRPSRIIFATTQRSVSDDFKARIGRLRGSEVLVFSDMYDEQST